jgi:isopentenyldiphosphate isomerase
LDSSAEILDVFDEDGVHLGVAPRSRVHADGLWHKTSQVWLINEYGELLLQLRSEQKSCFPGVWDISSAGHIPAGTKPIVSALRELEEELGVTATATELKFLFNHSEPYFGEHHIDREIAYIYLLKVKKETPLILQESEVSAVQWIPYKDLLVEYHRRPEEFVAHEKHFTKLLDYLQLNDF